MKNFLLIQPKPILKIIYPKGIWNINTKEKEIYLTFDDGPIPELSEWVLDTLKQFNAKATFFCVGSNILKHQTIFDRIIREEHTVANHTMFHSKGFQFNDEDYLNEVNTCQALVNNKLFRPPYGQLKRSQYKTLINYGYTIVFWDVISYDYEKISPQMCLNNVIKNTKHGSVVLFHDNIKAEKNLKYALPLFLKHFSNLGFVFKPLSSAN